MSQSQFLGSDLESRIIQFLRKPKRYNVITTWTAELQASLLMPEITQYPYLSEEERLQMRSGYNFMIKISKKLTPSQMKYLTILSWYLPEETRVLIQSGILEVSKVRRLEEQIDLTIYLKSKPYCLLLLQQQRISYTAFFGNLGQIIRLIQREVEVIPSKRKSEIIFSLPFWSPPSNRKVKKYTGWSRHHKDAGSLPPSGSHINREIQRDRLIQEDYEQKREKYERDIWSALELSIGFII